MNVMISKCFSNRCHFLARNTSFLKNVRRLVPSLTDPIQTTRNSWFIRHLHITKGNRKVFHAKHKMDGVPKDFTLVYSSSIGPWFLMFRVGVACICGTLLLAYAYSLPNFSRDFFLIGEGSFLVIVTAMAIISTSAFGFSARQFLTRIYHHTESGQFIGVRRTLFGRLKQLGYTTSDIEPTQLYSKTTNEGWDVVTVRIKGEKVYLQSKYFCSPNYYNAHLGTSAEPFKLSAQEPKF